MAWQMPSQVRMRVQKLPRRVSWLFFPLARWKPNAGIVRIDARLYRLLGEDEKIMTCGRMCTQALRSCSKS